jgi:hypothetical protein
MSSKFVPNFELNQGSSLRRPGIFPLLRGKQRRGAPMQAIPLVLEGEILMNPSYRWFAKIAFFLCAPELRRPEGAGANVCIWNGQLFRAGCQR